MKKIFRYWHFMVWLLLLIILYQQCGLQRLLLMRPQGEHAWAQCDRASTALLYYQDDMNFFRPQTHNLMKNPSGIASGELPLLSYTVAILYKVFGYHEILYRLVVLLFSLGGFFIAFLICHRLIRQRVYCLMAASLWLLSPNLIYFSTGFLPDNVALSFLLAGFYMLIYDYPAISKRGIIGFAIFSCIAALEKSSALMIYMSLCIPLLGLLWREQRPLRSKLHSLLILSIPVFVGLVWLGYSSWLQQNFPSVVFLLKPKLPANWDEFMKYLQEFKLRKTLYYDIELLILAVLSIPVSFALLKKPQRRILWWTVSVLLVWCLFFVLMCRQAWHHGYYHVPFQLAFLLVFLGLGMSLDRFRLPRWLSPILFIVLLGLTGLNIRHTVMGFRQLAYHQGLICNDWNTITPALRSAGIRPEDKVLSYPDLSYNISLYLMNQRGWNIAPDYWDATVEEALDDCDYMVLADPGLLERSIIKNYSLTLIGRYNSITIYKISKEKP